jgi:hypothetical protein
MRRLEAEDSDVPDNELIELVIKYAKINIFEKSYEESVSCFKLLENLENIRHTNGPNPSSLPVDDKNMYIC